MNNVKYAEVFHREMDLSEKIMYIIDNFKGNHPNRVVELYTSSETNHEKVYRYTLSPNTTRFALLSLLEDYERYGECAGSDPKGHWIRIIDFELIDEE